MKNQILSNPIVEPYHLPTDNIKARIIIILRLSCIYWHILDANHYYIIIIDKDNSFPQR